MNYIVCKKLGLDDNAAAKAGLLHDLFLYDWHGHKPEKGERMHGFEHPNKALKNAHDNFLLQKRRRYDYQAYVPAHTDTAII